MFFHRAFWLGLVHGITEFLPLSSHSHARLLQEMLSEYEYRVTYIFGFTCLAILLAEIIFFRKELKGCIVKIFKKKNYRLVLNIILSSVPLIILTAVYNRKIYLSEALNSFWLIAVGFAVMAVLLLNLKRLPKMKAVKSYEDLSIKNALCIGVANLFSVIPGISRFGISYITSRITGLDTKNALKYSYITSIPYLICVSIMCFMSKDAMNCLTEEFPQYLLAFCAAFVAALVVLVFCKAYFAKKEEAKAIGWYLTFASLIILVFELLK